MSVVLYLHGFASSPASRKIDLIREHFSDEPIELVIPDLNVPSFERLDVDAMLATAVEAGRARPPDAMVGSSLGALLALEVVRRGIVVPLVLIAPAIGVSEQWIARIPDFDPLIVYNHAREANTPIHRTFFEQISRLVPYADPPEVPVSVIMGRRDESVPFESVAGVWRAWEETGRLARGSRFIELAEGDHGLLDYSEVIAGEIRRRVKGEG